MPDPLVRVQCKLLSGMGCASCGNGENGLPAGCKNNGACGVGGCNKLEVFDWLSNMELPTGAKPFDVVEVRFKNGRKHFFREPAGLSLCMGDVVAVEASPGHDIGIVSLTGELVRLQMKRKNIANDRDMRKVYRKARQEDLDIWKTARGREEETMLRSRKLAYGLMLDMKICDVEFQGDNSKAVFYYTAEGRIDFRELIRVLAEEFRVRVEMRQIGARQEASRVGGIGSCGRELCCTTWLTDFRSVSTSAARYQQLSLNPQKLAGQCGKLKCCLNYELDSYLDAIKDFPKSNIKLRTKAGTGVHFKTDIFKRTMWFTYEETFNGNLMALSVDQVLEIADMNKRNVFPEDLRSFVEVEESEEPSLTDLALQDSLTRFDQKRKKKKRRKPGGTRAEGAPQARPEGTRPNVQQAPAKGNPGGPIQGPTPGDNRNRKPRRKNRNRKPDGQ